MTAVLLDIHDGWAELILNRPERKNAIEGQLAQAMHEALDRLAPEDSVRAVVLRGAGGAFCSGLDVKAFNADPPAPWKAGFAVLWDAVHNQLLASRKVLITALERYAINGGAALALAGDLMVCGRSAFLQVGEIGIGMAAPRNAAWLALRHSEAVAARVCLMGDRVGAAELLRLGIATEVVDDETVLARAQAMAQAIAAFPAHSVQAVKSGMRAATMQMPTGRWMEACAKSDAFSQGGAIQQVGTHKP
ncbi:enoyl-CoA hydratase/isomerase family protein [Xenophilus arseniciresistens]|uniref:Enoyl-CoA hydratase/isomerase family protein n=1 Tax=Xenophilus arseniciresistens TaxID=1283306 RepID=A0AAE3N6Y5_9BURK|nr:enoyl-CoA hydratase/isomerase family protein [Xenophilus arseniciresistens]MDA7416028.1 enoyl-CoA hydratase/isomerase family protein [Xenophilus arseniciresistens]